MLVNISDLQILIDNKKAEKDQAISLEMERVQREVINPKNDQIDTVYNQIVESALTEKNKSINDAEQARNNAVQNAERICDNKIKEAKKVADEGKEKFAKEQYDLAKIKVGNEYNDFINDLTALSEKYGG